MKIMVGFDGSNVSKAALKLAAERAQAFDAQILLVQSMVGGPEVPKRDFENAERELGYQKSQLKQENIACESLLSIRGWNPGRIWPDWRKNNRWAKSSWELNAGQKSVNSYLARPHST
jgi:hypothetical protein